MRILHTMLRVVDLDRSLAFYTDVLGMHLLRRQDYPEGRFTLAFVGYGKEEDEAVLELTHNWDTKHYELGTAYGHIALEVPRQGSEVRIARRLGPNLQAQDGTLPWLLFEMSATERCESLNEVVGIL